MERVWLKHYPAGVPADVEVNPYPSIVAPIEESFPNAATKQMAKAG